MIKSIRIYHTSDGGTLDIGASAKTIIEVNGAKISLLDIIQLSMLSLAEVVKVDGLTTVISHRCPELKAPDPEPAKVARRKKLDEE